jgi:hypothetical protein
MESPIADMLASCTIGKDFAMSRGLLVWLLIMLIETIHGVLRGLFVVPRFGEEAASRIGWPIGMIIVLGVSYLTIRWIGLRDTSNLIRLGALWAILTFVFEVLIGVLRGLDSPAIWAEINPLAGGLMVYSLAVMLVAPLAAARLRGLH